MNTIRREQKLTKAQLTKYLRSATCPYCGGRLSAHHTRSTDGKNLPMTYRCTQCGRNPREAIARHNPEPAGSRPGPEGEGTMDPKKTDKAPGKKNGGEQHDEAAVTQKGRVHTIAKPRANPVTGKAAAPPEEVPDAAKIEAKRAAEAKTPATVTGPEQPDDAGDTVVFAFRLSRSERDEIHAATGSAKASKFIRTLALAGARRDLKTIQETMDGVHVTCQ